MQYKVGRVASVSRGRESFRPGLPVPKRCQEIRQIKIYGADYQECFAHVLRYLKDSIDNKPDQEKISGFEKNIAIFIHTFLLKISIILPI